MKKLLLLSCILLLTSCGNDSSRHFKDNGPVSCSQLEIKPIATSNRRIEFLLNKKLLQYTKCATSHDTKRLEIRYKTFDEEFGIQINSIATRKKVGIVLYYRLWDLTTPDTPLLIRGKIKRSGSFYVEDSTYSSLVAELQELENLLDPIINELLLKMLA